MKITLPNIQDYDYHLPEERIAKYPLEERDESKLLHYNKGEITHSAFHQLPDILASGDMLVFNNTKVIKARLAFYKTTGAHIEIFCLEPMEPADYYQNFQAQGEVTWKCLIGNKKKWKSGPLMQTLSTSKGELKLTANLRGTLEDAFAVHFTWDNSDISFGEIIEQAGNLPIPPYLHRETEALDLERYQTVYSKVQGSVAAPTAGLHFTDRVFSQIRKKGIKMAELTLHVGAGTFKPVSEQNLQYHTMHTEHFSVGQSFLETIVKQRGDLVAVGTTSVRTLESLYFLGLQVMENPGTSPGALFVSQWEPYTIKNSLPDTKTTLTSLMEYMQNHKLKTLDASTQIMIVPGYQFRLVNKLITNFHMPKSTLLLLIAAFVGNDWGKIYGYALAQDFRFLSYGDSSLLER
ncbi:MAG: S-adenosylmethionine:tRNA ribosyltransferase-isomerase [Bacteroidota bacterium]